MGRLAPDAKLARTVGAYSAGSCGVSVALAIVAQAGASAGCLPLPGVVAAIILYKVSSKSGALAIRRAILSSSVHSATITSSPAIIAQIRLLSMLRTMRQDVCIVSSIN